jgi:carotenoid 9,10(9',10')-cleavage dioxygenase 1
VVKSGGFPIVFAQGEPSRFGLLPVNAHSESDIMWFTLPRSIFIFHTIAAYDDPSESGGSRNVVLWACVRNNVSLILEENVAQGRDEDCFVAKFVFNTSAGSIAMQSYADEIVGWALEHETMPRIFDFPTIRPGRTGLPVQFCYLAVYERSLANPKCPIGAVVGVVKFDLRAGKQCGKIFFGGAVAGAIVHGGESVFVPRDGSTVEDDGFLVTIVTDIKSGKSALHVYDALTMSVDPVVVVLAPCRLPSGFHSTFVSQKTLRTLAV